MDWRNDTPKGGLPHSDIHGSKPARGSPWLFAACHVLHRLLVPRHPPNALIILRSRAFRGRSRIRPPCTETIVRTHAFKMDALNRGTRGEPRSSSTIVPFGSQSSRHRTRTFDHSLRRMENNPDQYTQRL